MLSGAVSQSSGAPAAIARDRIDDRGQLFVVDVDRLDRIARRLARLGDDRDHRLAAKAHGSRERVARRATAGVPSAR